MSEKYWTAEDLADHGYRLEQAPEDQAEQDDAYCITGADEPLSQRVNKRSREYIFKNVAASGVYCLRGTGGRVDAVGVCSRFSGAAVGGCCNRQWGS